MDHAGEAGLKMWDEEIRGETRTHIWCEEDDYVLVVADRKTFVLPWTGFHLNRDHERRKFERRWQNFRA